MTAAATNTQKPFLMYRIIWSPMSYALFLGLLAGSFSFFKRPNSYSSACFKTGPLFLSIKFDLNIIKLKILYFIILIITSDYNLWWCNIVEGYDSNRNKRINIWCAHNMTSFSWCSISRCFAFSVVAVKLLRGWGILVFLCFVEAVQNEEYIYWGLALSW